MANTYSWHILSMEYRIVESGFDKVVKRIVAFYKADNGDGVVEEQLLNTALGPLNPTEFTAYESITEADAIAWLEAALGEANLAYWRGELDRMVEAATAMVVDAPPWT